MNKTETLKLFLAFTGSMMLLFPGDLRAVQETPSDELRQSAIPSDTLGIPFTPREDSLLNYIRNDEYSRVVLYPGGAGHSILVPGGWWGTGPAIFGGLGGNYPVPYSDKPDMAVSAGFGFGNAAKYCQFTVVGVINDVSRFERLSASATISRTIGRSSSLAIGGSNLFHTRESDSHASYFIVFSHAVQKFRYHTHGNSRINYSIGIGNERFLKKNPTDVKKGKGEYGTGVFAAVSYMLLKNWNISAEWTGINLGLGTGYTHTFFHKLPVSICFGVADLTRMTGPKPRFVFSIGTGYSFLK